MLFTIKTHDMVTYKNTNMVQYDFLQYINSILFMTQVCLMTRWITVLF